MCKSFGHMHVYQSANVTKPRKGEVALGSYSGKPKNAKIIENMLRLETGSWFGRDLDVSVMRVMISQGLTCNMKVTVNNNISLTFAQSHSVGSIVGLI